MTALTTLEDLAVEQIKSGDEFWNGGRFFWRAIDDAETNGEVVTLSVVYADGGHGPSRQWTVGQELTVQRPVTA